MDWYNFITTMDSETFISFIACLVGWSLIGISVIRFFEKRGN